MKSKKSIQVFFPVLFCLLFLSINGSAQGLLLQGKVTDAANGEPLPGVSVLIKGTFTGTATNIDGEYTLQVQPGNVVEFSFLGYKSQSFTVNGQHTLDVALSEDLQQLQEVVVIGYGQVRKNDADRKSVV